MKTNEEIKNKIRKIIIEAGKSNEPSQEDIIDITMRITREQERERIIEIKDGIHRGNNRNFIEEMIKQKIKEIEKDEK